MSNDFHGNMPGGLSHPDELEEYIQVTTPPVWVVVIAMLIFVLGLLAFCIFGTLTIHTENGMEEQVHPITFLIN